MTLVCVFYLGCVVFFKQKTAYYMRISDWSSDVCSSDLRVLWPDMGDQRAQVQVPRSTGNCPGSVLLLFAGYAQGDCQLSVARAGESGIGVGDSAAVVEIGRAHV